MVDAVWNDSIVPVMRHRFPRITPQELTTARAYAYGGSVIQDLGYYPFGSKLFTNLVHYVRSGDFVESLIRNARDPNEYAFALGALAHYASDNAGHAISVNRALPIEYPRLRAKFGDEVLFAEAPARHLMLEFAFDVYQIGAAGYASQAYRDFIGFEVAKSLLARASKETYALDLDELFPNQDMAIGTYRHAISTTIPHLTLLAWKDKQKEIRARTPGIERSRFVFTFTQVEYDRTFGTTYKKPGLLSRFVVVLFKILPKFGAFRTLAFKPLTPETAKLFVESFEAARERYRASLRR